MPGFIGSPRMNLIEGQEAAKQNAVTLGVRPEHMRISKTEGAWKGTVGVTEHLGSDTFIHVQVDGVGKITVRTDGDFSTEFRPAGLSHARSRRGCIASMRTARQFEMIGNLK